MIKYIWFCDNCEVDFVGNNKEHVCPLCGLGDISLTDVEEEKFILKEEQK